MDAKELTDQVYDTLSGNVGLSEYHIALKPESIALGECLNTAGEIRFMIDGKFFLLKITEIPCPEQWIEDGNDYTV